MAERTAPPPRNSVVLGCAFAAALSLVWLTRPDDFWPLVSSVISSYFLFWGAVIGFSRVPLREVGHRFLVCSAALAVVLGTLETIAALRLVDFRAVFHNPVEPAWRPSERYDRELLHIHKPHLRNGGLFLGGDIAVSWHLPSDRVYPYELRTDANGFRNDSDLTSADVAVVGDSFVEAQNCIRADLMTTQIATATGLTVANLGQAFYGPQQELAVIRRYAVPLHPSVVVWVFFEGNDLEDVQRYARVIGTWPQIYQQRDGLARRSFSHGAVSAVLRLLESRAPSPVAAGRSGILTSDATTRMYFSYPGEPLDSSGLAAIKALPRLYEEVHGLLRSRGSRLIVAFAPTAWRVYHDLVRLESGSEASRWVVDDLPDRLSAIVRTASPEAAFVDLTPALASAARSGALVYYPDDSHWTPEGHRICAEALTPVILQAIARAAK